MRSEWVDVGNDGWADEEVESDAGDPDVVEAYDPVFCKTVTVRRMSSAGPSGVAGQAPGSLDAAARPGAERPAPAGRQLDTAPVTASEPSGVERISSAAHAAGSVIGAAAMVTAAAAAAPAAAAGGATTAVVATSVVTTGYVAGTAGYSAGSCVGAVVGATTGGAAQLAKEARETASVGARSRGSDGNDGYRFGDWTRGVVARGAESRGGEQSYRFGDFTRGIGRLLGSGNAGAAMAPMRDVEDRFIAAESFGNTLDEPTY